MRVDTLSKTEQDKVSPTGKIICQRLDGKTETSSAQLTRRADVLTGSAHTFIDPDTCKPLVRLSTCRLHLSDDDEGFELKEMAANGFGNCSDARLDWGIFVLKKKVPGVHPYPVDPQIVRNLKKGQKLLSVGLSKDFPEWRNGKIIGHPKHEAHCAIIDIFNNGVLGTTCGVGSGASGGSCLSDSDNPSLIGVIRSNTESNDEEDWAVAHHTTNVRHYHKKNWQTSCVPITGDFLNAIDKIKSRLWAWIFSLKKGTSMLVIA